MINSNKHEITWSNLAQDASSEKTVLLAIGTQPSVTNLASEVGIGSKINAIYFEFHFSPEVITNTKVIHWIIECVNDGQAGSVPSTYFTTTRSLIIKRGMEMLVKDVGTVYKRIFVIRIPKIYSRMRDQAEIRLKYICTSAETINACGIAIYKSYT